MRPIDKGEKPKQKFKKYGDAAPFLETRIGAYCSYCEFPIKHVPEVDHVVSKSKGGELLEWDNFLLACKYCNTRKKAVVDENNKANFLWPDEYNTFMAYTYKNGIPKIDRSNLQDKGVDIIEKAENLFKLVKLDNQTVKDMIEKRWQERSRVAKEASDAREAWEKYSKMRETADIKIMRDDWVKNTILLAQAEGFFSVWMEAFEDVPFIRKLLIEAFIGTNRNCFDNDGNPVWWAKSD